MTERTSDDNDGLTFAELSPEVMLRVNEHCDRLEAAWAQNCDISLREFVKTLPADDRAVTIPELILIDLALRSRRGSDVPADEYLRMFPDVDANWLNRQIEIIKTSRQAPGAEGDLEKLVRLGDYAITGTLGCGGMGQVYRAVHQIMGREVAIKVLHQQLRSDSFVSRRFEREVQVLAQLSHPNIVTAFDARWENGRLYLVTERVKGEDLGRLVGRKGPLKPTKAMYYVWQAAKGLSYAHQKGIVHRDIKPNNLFVDERQSIKVLDLGLARLSANDKANLMSDASLTQSGQVLGTAPYLAPEQARSPLTAGPHADIYSLGCTLYFLIVGQPPYQGKTRIDTILAHVEQATPKLPETVNGRRVSSGLRQLCHSMMAKSPTERPESMIIVVETLERLIKQEKQQIASGSTRHHDVRATVMSSRPTTPATQSDERTNWPSVKALTSIGLVAIAVVVAAFVWHPWFNRRLSPNINNSLQSGVTEHQASGPKDTVPSRESSAARLTEGINTNSKARGLQFNGYSSYVAIPDFKIPVAAPVRIELAACANYQESPVNLVSWTGDKLAVLFIGGDHNWGICFFDGQQSRLVISRQRVRFGQLETVVGEWNGSRLSLWIDGRKAETDPVDYPLQAAPPGLYVGGVPDNVFPAEQGTRFFSGLIAAVRISQGNLPETRAASVEDFEKLPPTNILGTNFAFTRNDVAEDLSLHHWRMKRVDTHWQR